ncbi:hypothetical protein MRX96_041195 [Rhipicephalus microplus]
MRRIAPVTHEIKEREETRKAIRNDVEKVKTVPVAKEWPPRRRMHILPAEYTGASWRQYIKLNAEGDKFLAILAASKLSPTRRDIRKMERRVKKDGEGAATVFPSHRHGTAALSTKASSAVREGTSGREDGEKEEASPSYSSFLTSAEKKNAQFAAKRIYRRHGPISDACGGRKGGREGRAVYTKDITDRWRPTTAATAATV